MNDVTFAVLQLFPPYLLAGAGALLALVGVVPSMRPGLGYRRWFQYVVAGAWVVALVIVGLTVAYSSPWLLIGAGIVVAAGAAFVAVRERLSRGLEEEALELLQSLISIMSADLSLLQGLQEIAANSDFERAFPRMVDQTRAIMSEVALGRPLSGAVSRVAESIPVAARPFWSQVREIAILIEADTDNGMTLRTQYNMLTSLWAVLFRVHQINEEMKQKMSQMNGAKYLFAAILPALNAFMYWRVPSTRETLTQPIGFAFLGIEVVALIAIFVLMSILQRTPEVRV